MFNTHDYQIYKQNKQCTKERGKLDILKYRIIKFKSSISTKIPQLRHSSIFSYITQYHFHFDTIKHAMHTLTHIQRHLIVLPEDSCIELEGLHLLYNSKLWIHTVPKSMNHQSCMIRLASLRLFWPIIFQIAFTQSELLSTLTT